MTTQLTLPRSDCDNVTNFLILVVECGVYPCGARVGLLGCRWLDICGIYTLDKSVFYIQVRIFTKIVLSLLITDGRNSMGYD